MAATPLLAIAPAASDQIVNPGQAADLSKALHHVELDPEACYKVRDLSFERGGVRLFLTDGYVIFSRPIRGRRTAAVYRALDSGDDAEFILRPPVRSERAALAQATGSPNLNSHFALAVMLFTDETAEELTRQIESGLVKRRPEQGLIISSQSSETVRNLLKSFETRMIGDLLGERSQTGFFFATLASKDYGNMDLLFDPLSPEPLVAGAVDSGKGSMEFRIWTNYAPPNFVPPEPKATVGNYRIDATLGPDLHLEVATRATVRAGAAPVDGALVFELAPEMTIESASMDGRPVEVFRRESLRANLIGRRSNEPFLIVLPEPLPPGSAHEIEIRHGGKVIRRAGNDVFFVAARTNWYPVHNPQFTTFDLTFRSPKAWQVVATGEEVEDRVEGDTRVVRHVTKSPVRLAGFNVGDYASVRVERGGYKVEVCANKALEPNLATRATSYIMVPPAWPSRGPVRRTSELIAVTAPPPDPRGRLALLAQTMATDFEWMAQQFGPPPLNSLVASPIPGFFGQGFPGLLYLSTVLYLNEPDRPASMRSGAMTTFYNEILHSHEISHQWWGNLVTSGSYRDDWLMEALANYTAWMVLERKKGARALEDQLEAALSSLRVTREDKPIESFGPLTWGSRLQSSTAPDPWRPIIYEKGGWVIHMLRRRMGDAAFMKMLAALVSRFSYKPITTEQFREHAAGFLPPGTPDPHLGNFFDHWVYGTGIPQLNVTTSVRGKAPSVDLKVTVTQSGVGEDFSVDLPVEIRFSGAAKPIVKWIRTGPDPVVLSLRLRSAPSKVEVAPGRGVLAIRK